MFDLTFIDKYGTTVTNLTQWDMNQKIYIESSSFDNKAPQFHFCNKNSEKALVVQSKIEGDLLEITVPNALLIEPYPITVYAYLMDIDNSVESGKTIEYTTIPVRQRPEPSDFTYEENTDIVDVQDIVAEIVAYNQQIKLEEKARVEAESLRVEAENQRKSNEEQRQLNAEEVIQNAETATVRANEAAEVCEDLIENLGGNAEIVHSSEKGAANGVATLDENGKLPMTQIPDDLNFELPEEIDATTLSGYSADDFERKSQNAIDGRISYPTSGQYVTLESNSQNGFLVIDMPMFEKGDGHTFSFRLDIKHPYHGSGSGSQQHQETYLISGIIRAKDGWKEYHAVRLLPDSNYSAAHNKVYFYSKYDSDYGGYNAKIYIGDENYLNASWYYTSVSISDLVYGVDYYYDSSYQLGGEQLYNLWDSGFKIYFTYCKETNYASTDLNDIKTYSSYRIVDPVPKNLPSNYAPISNKKTFSSTTNNQGLLQIKMPEITNDGNVSFCLTLRSLIYHDNSSLTGLSGFFGEVRYYFYIGYIKTYSKTSISNVYAYAVPLNMPKESTFDGEVSPVLPVYFSLDESDYRFAVLIGDKNNLEYNWNYFEANITDVIGYPSTGWDLSIITDSTLADNAIYSIENPSIVSSSNAGSDSSSEYVFNLDSTDQYLKVKLPCSIPKLYNYYDSDYNARSLEDYLKCHYSFKIKLEDKYGGNWAEYLVHCTLNDYDCIEYQSASVLGCGSNLYSGYSYHDYSNFTFNLWYKEIVDNIDSVKSYLSKFIDVYGVESNGSSSELIPYIFIQTGINDFTRITIKDINYYFDYDEEPNISLKVPFPNLLEDIISNGEWEVSAASEVDYGEYTSITTIENPSIHSARMIDGQNAQDYINSAVGILGLYTYIYRDDWCTLVQSKASRDNGFEFHISADSGSDILDIVFNYCPQGYTSRPENFKLNVVYSNQLESKHLIDKIRILRDTDSTMYLQVHRTSVNMDSNYINARMRNTRNWEYANSAPSESATVLVECDVAAQVSTLTSANSTPVSVSTTEPETNYLWADTTDISDTKLKVYDTENSEWVTINAGDSSSGGNSSASTLEGLTTTVDELNYMSGATSNIQEQLNNKVETIEGKGLSTNDFTDEYKDKLDNLSTGGEEVTGDYIPTSEKGVASGVATLGEDGKVPTSQLPNIVNTGYISTTEDFINALAVGGIIELEPHKTFIFDDTITWNHDTTTIIGNGATLDFSAITDNRAAIHVISKEGVDDDGMILPSLRNCAIHYIEGCYILGGNTTPNYEGGRNGYGFLLKGDDTTLQHAAFVIIKNCTIAGFLAGIVCQNQSWCLTVDSSNINVCDYGLTVSYGYLNYGEKISVVNSVINTCTVGVACSSSFCGTVQCVNTSIDHCFMSASAATSSKIILSNCHLESAKNKNYIFKVSSEAIIFVTNSVFNFEQSNFGICEINDTGKIILKDNIKETWSVGSNTISTNGKLTEEWLGQVSTQY